MPEFGECPECGKMCLVIVGDVKDMSGYKIGIRVKCVNCGYAKTVYY